MKIKIISDGTPWNTKVINIDTNEEIKNIRSIEWKVSVDKNAEVIIHFTDVAVNIEGEIK